jgi:formylmethanofuran dehydrogenase subunit C
VTILILKLQPQAPMDASVLSPDIFQEKSALEIANLPLLHGAEQALLGDFFKIEGDENSRITLNGDLGCMNNIASGMTHGWVIIHGNAGNRLGAGMNRGSIFVEGNAGNEAGMAMRRGCIAIKGNAGDHTGSSMIAGSMIVFGAMGIGAGSDLLRGTIVAFQPPELPPTFRYDCTYQPDFLKLLFRSLQSQGLSIHDKYANGYYRRYSGDFSRIGKGEILVYDQR